MGSGIISVIGFLFKLEGGEGGGSREFPDTQSYVRVTNLYGIVVV